MVAPTESIALKIQEKFFFNQSNSPAKMPIMPSTTPLKNVVMPLQTEDTPSTAQEAQPVTVRQAVDAISHTPCQTPAKNPVTPCQTLTTVSRAWVKAFVMAEATPGKMVARLAPNAVKNTPSRPQVSLTQAQAEDMAETTASQLSIRAMSP